MIKCSKSYELIPSVLTIPCISVQSVVSELEWSFQMARFVLSRGFNVDLRGGRLTQAIAVTSVGKGVTMPMTAGQVGLEVDG